MQLFAGVQSMGQGFATKAEIKQVFSVEGVGIKVDMQRFKQLCKSGGEQLLTILFCSNSRQRFWLID